MLIVIVVIIVIVIIMIIVINDHHNIIAIIISLTDSCMSGCSRLQLRGGELHRAGLASLGRKKMLREALLLLLLLCMYISLYICNIYIYIDYT